MHFPRRLLHSCTCLLFFVACGCQAGTVLLNDGSILHGQIENLREGQLTLSTSYAGTIAVQAASIRGLETSQPLIVSRADGREMRGRLIYLATDAGKQYINLTGTAGRRQLNLASIVEMRPVGSASLAQIRAQKKQAERQQAEVQARRNLWTGSVALGIQGRSGNSESRDIDLAAKAKRETENNRLTLSAEVHRAREGGAETEADYLGLARLEHDINGRFFVYGQAQGERDEFKNINLRLRATAGLGYFVLEQPDQTFKLRMGVGYEHVDLTGDGKNDDLIATFGYDYMWKLADWNKLTHSLTIIPKITGQPLHDYRIESVLADELPLGSTASLWSLRAELRNEYNSQPEPGVERLDTTYVISIVRKFE